jgi:hypothetical protein
VKKTTDPSGFCTIHRELAPSPVAASADAQAGGSVDPQLDQTLDPTIDLEGFLVKGSLSSGRNFKRRFVVLHRNKISYFDSEKILKGSFLFCPQTAVKVLASTEASPRPAEASALPPSGLPPPSLPPPLLPAPSLPPPSLPPPSLPPPGGAAASPRRSAAPPPRQINTAMQKAAASQAARQPDLKKEQTPRPSAVPSALAMGANIGAKLSGVKGALLGALASAVPDSATATQFGFTVCTSDQLLELYASTAEERDRWVRAVNANLQYLRTTPKG